jgi:hypothetical protein
MKIDSTHWRWAVGSVAALAIAAAVYVGFGVRSIQGPRGGGALGLTFGAAGYGLMLFAGLLGVRKKFSIWRVGRAQTWMRGHAWLGLLSFPLILFHAGFAFHGPLTAVLMALFVIVTLSGLAGVAIQYFVPRMMTAEVPMETIYEEIPHVREQLLEEADQLVTAAGDNARLQDVYHLQIRPYLEQPKAEMFPPLRAALPAAVHGVLDDLENICEEQRQLNRQIRLYNVLHGWLLVHVPLSILLLALGGVHAIMALRY